MPSKKKRIEALEREVKFLQSRVDQLTLDANIYDGRFRDSPPHTIYGAPKWSVSSILSLLLNRLGLEIKTGYSYSYTSDRIAVPQ